MKPGSLTSSEVIPVLSWGYILMKKLIVVDEMRSH